MSQINPIVGALLQSTSVQRSQSAEKQTQIHRVQQLARNIAAQDDQLEHSVESSDALSEIKDDRDHEQEQKRKKREHEQYNSSGEADDQDGPKELDITA